MARILSLGSSLQDVYLIDHDDLVPTQIGEAAIFGKVLVGEKVDIDQIKYGVGGGGVNSAITFARHGHEVILMSNISRDPAGMAITRTLAREGIDNSYMNFLEKKSTGTSVILLDRRSGERTILTYRGASEQFGNFDENDLNLIQPDWIYITTLRGDLETLKRFLVKAREIGMKVMFNPGVRELEQADELLKLLKYIDILNVNESEAARLVPGKTLTELAYHLSGYVRVCIITAGAMGGIAYSADEGYRFGIYEDVKIKDTTGAGDAFGSGFLASLASGKSFKKSLEFASANSTAVVQKIGGNTGILCGGEKLHPMPIQKIN